MANSDQSEKKTTIYSDVLVSMPLIVPSLEDADLNGFAFSGNMGVIVAMNRPEDRKDSLAKLRGWNW